MLFSQAVGALPWLLLAVSRSGKSGARLWLSSSAAFADRVRM